LSRERSSIEEVVTIGKDQRALLELVLPPSSRRLEVRSIPSGASVYLDGNLVIGETPCEVTVTDDDFHQLRVEKVGFEPIKRALTPETSDPILTLTLKPETIPRGMLIVYTEGVYDLLLDGKESGWTTPTDPLLIDEGSHTVALRDAAGKRSPPTPVRIVRGQTVQLRLSHNPVGK
jgi:hypothetical protein